MPNLEMPKEIYVRQFETVNKIKKLTAYFKKPVRNQWPRIKYVRADCAVEYFAKSLADAKVETEKWLRKRDDKPSSDPRHTEEWRRINSNDSEAI